jgi:hypothetical protein
MPTCKCIPFATDHVLMTALCIGRRSFAGSAEVEVTIAMTMCGKMPGLHKTLSRSQMLEIEAVLGPPKKRIRSGRSLNAI